MHVRPLFLPTVAVFSLFGIFLFSPISHAQINAPPSSLTSPGFGGRSVNGPAPSVTSVGPRGYSQPGHFPMRPPSANTGNGHRHHHNSDYVGPYLYAYPVPYAVDPSGYVDAPDSGDGTYYEGGPTVFDRRGSGARSYVPPVEDAPAPHAAAQTEPLDSAAADPDPSAPSTLLVFKDGHQLEIGNYAIVGVTLFDLTPGHPRKIPLANLDLDATQKQNESRDVTFQVPTSLQGN